MLEINRIEDTVSQIPSSLSSSHAVRIPIIEGPAYTILCPSTSFTAYSRESTRGELIALYQAAEEFTRRRSWLSEESNINPVLASYRQAIELLKEGHISPQLSLSKENNEPKTLQSSAIKTTSAFNGWNSDLYI